MKKSILVAAILLAIPGSLASGSSHQRVIAIAGFAGPTGGVTWQNGFRRLFDAEDKQISCHAAWRDVPDLNNVVVSGIPNNKNARAFSEVALLAGDAHDSKRAPEGFAVVVSASARANVRPP